MRSEKGNVCRAKIFGSAQAVDAAGCSDPELSLKAPKRHTTLRRLESLTIFLNKKAKGYYNT